MNQKNLLNFLHIAEENWSRKWRLKFHLTPKTGYMGNIFPTSLNSTHHIFFQYSPFNTSDTIDFWGHFSTEDFINYKRLPPSLFANHPADTYGLLSGSVLFDKTLNIFYAGKTEGSKGLENNLIHFENNKKTLFFTHSDLPKNTTSFTGSPKVFKTNNEYLMLLGSENKDMHGELLLYTSPNKYSWRLKNIISKPELPGNSWSSPDYFVIDDIQFICYSYEEKCGYVPLDGNLTDAYRLSCFSLFDHGFDFYAPQIYKDNNGRLIMIAKMGTTENNNYQNPTKEFGWLHAITIPRVISQRNGKIIQRPIDEIDNLRKNKTTEHFSGEKHFNNFIIFDSFIKGKNLHIIIHSSLEIYCKETEITINFIKNSYGRISKTIPVNKAKNLRILTDISSVEIFINDGETTFTTRFYPENDDYDLFIEGNNVSVTIWNMNEFNYT